MNVQTQAEFDLARAQFEAFIKTHIDGLLFDWNTEKQMYAGSGTQFLWEIFLAGVNYAS